MSAVKDFIKTTAVTREDVDRAWYGSVLSNMGLFKRSGGRTDDLSATDTPGHYYFKIFFYFDNPSEDGNMMASNFLSRAFNTQMTGITDFPWKNSANTKDGENKQNTIGYGTTGTVNTAMNYLLLNNEWERAEKLDKFIGLLMNISTYSPWYFSSITGLDTALERKEFTDKEFKIDEERKKIEIKCLPDAYDTRIGTLVDLYRDITYSYQLHKEIVPANLRKFDMGIFIFNTPIKNIHGDVSKYARFDNRSGSEYLTSYKYIELQNCEIDYNASKSAYGDFSNADGKQMEYTITISADSVMEKRYNEILMREIGDFIKWDIDYRNDPTYQKDDAKHYQEFKNRLALFETGDINLLGNNRISSPSSLLGTVANRIFEKPKRLIKSFLMTNLNNNPIAKLMQDNRKAKTNYNVGKNLHADQQPKTSRAMEWKAKRFSGYPDTNPQSQQ